MAADPLSRVNTLYRLIKISKPKLFPCITLFVRFYAVVTGTRRETV